MPSTDPPWPLPRLSTNSAAAAACYQKGIAALVAGIAHAESYLAHAVAIDPTFHLAHVGIAVAKVAAGQPYASPPHPVSSMTRGERQHAEIVEAAFTGRSGHAGDLRREHLAEYPCDVLVVWLPALFDADGVEDDPAR